MQWMMRVIFVLEKVFILVAVALVVYAVIYLNKPVALPVVLTQTASVDVSSTDNVVEMALVSSADVGVVEPQRDLFDAAGAPADLGVNNAAMSNMLPANFKVVGIIIGQSSQIAIEDTASHQTYIIAKGSQEQGIEVMDIHRDQALLKYQGQAITLPLQLKQ